MLESHWRILSHVETSFPWNWPADYIADLERDGLVKIEHGRSDWSLTEAGRSELKRIADDQ